MRMHYFPTSVLYPDLKTNRMIMREISDPETMEFQDENEADCMKIELEKCGLLVEKRKVKVRHDNVSIFFDSGKITVLDVYPPEIDLDSLSIDVDEMYNDDLDPKELPPCEEDISEILKYY